MQSAQIKKSKSLNNLVLQVSKLNANDLNIFIDKVNQNVLRRKDIDSNENELALLGKIKEIIPASIVRNLKKLQRKLHEETLTENERIELLQITDFIEEKSAERINLLAELAKIRKISVQELIKQLDLKNFHG